MGELQPEPLEQQRLGSVRPHHTADAQFTLRSVSQRQDDIRALDAPQLVQDGARGSTEPGALLPLFEGLPQHVLDIYGRRIAALVDGCQDKGVKSTTLEWH